MRLPGSMRSMWYPIVCSLSTGIHQPTMRARSVSFSGSFPVTSGGGMHFAVGTKTVEVRIRRFPPSTSVVRI